MNQKLESKYLTRFEFSITGESFEENANKIAVEYYNSRNLRPIKIVIDGAPYTPQAELAELIADYYGLHVIKPDRFVQNYFERFVLKMKKVEDYISNMKRFESDDPNIIQMMKKAKSYLEELRTNVRRPRFH